MINISHVLSPHLIHYQLMIKFCTIAGFPGFEEQDSGAVRAVRDDQSDEDTAGE